MGNIKNYKEQGGNKWVIGGELEFKEGAAVTGLPTNKIEKQANSTAKDIETLVADFNSLLSKLKEAGLMEK